LPDILSVVRGYYNIYIADPSLSRLMDIPFKNTIHFVFGHPVFGPLSGRKGPLTFEDMEEVQNACSETCIDGQTERQPIFPPTSDVKKMAKLRRELGYSGVLSVQYGEDLKLLPLKDAHKRWLLIHHGPTSDKYIAIAKQDPKFRRDCLLKLFHKGKPSSNCSRSSIGSQ